MFHKTKGILLKKTKLSGNGLILKFYTEQSGIKSYFGRITKKQKNAYLPLSIAHITAYDNPKKEINNIKEYELSYPLRNLYNDIFKSNIVLFLSEVLSNVIQEEDQNIATYRFIESSIIQLEEEELNINFHLIFLMQLTQFLGFEPHLDQSNSSYFDLEEGILINHIPVHSNFLDESETLLIKSLYESSFNNQTHSFSNKERKRLLHIMVNYFRYHTEMRELKSLPVLETIFS